MSGHGAVLQPEHHVGVGVWGEAAEARPHLLAGGHLGVEGGGQVRHLGQVAVQGGQLQVLGEHGHPGQVAELEADRARVQISGTPCL